MRVLKIIHTMGHGGAENIYRWLAWELRQEGIDVVAGIPLDNGPAQSENWITPALEELGIPYETFDKTGSGLDLLRNMISLIKRVRPDIVHSHLLDSNFYSSLACKWLSVPHVCTEHGDISFRNVPSVRIKFACTSALSKTVVCVSEAVRSRARSLTVFRNKLDLIYNGIRFSDAKASTFRREFGVPDHALLIGNVGNLYPVKGQRFLLDAFAPFLKSFPDAYVVFVGRGNEKENLKKQVARLAIPEDRVIFTGFRNDIGNILNSLDIFVLPSLSEGLPVSLLEALSAGIPVIATDVGGVGEVLGRDEYGMLVPPGSPEDIYKCLEQVGQNLDRYKARGSRSHRYVKEHFSLDTMTKKYIDLYNDLLRN